MEPLREQIVGIDHLVPLLDGSEVTYVNLDNAASTPSLRPVLDAVNQFMPYYSSVHRGTGFKSRLSTEAYDRAHEITARFVGADPEERAVILGKNTTEAINKLAYRLPLDRDSVVVTTQMEHHSNDLPWRERAEVVHVAVTREGRLDEDDFDRQLERYGERVALVAVSGASNVTGYLQPIHRLARKAHEVGALILVDAAQLAPHRAIDMKALDDPERLDFLAISAHKLYAPFGTGVLIGPKDIFLASPPEYRGGGTVDIVTLEEVTWAGMPDRDEAGSPNVVGAVALAASLETLMEYGMEKVASHEGELLDYALRCLQEVPGIKLYGMPEKGERLDKVGVIPFNLEGTSHFLTAAILGYEYGIGVRSGCFCAHPYVVHILDLPSEEAGQWREQIRQGDRSDMPGMVRASFGCYNDRTDVDRLVDALHQITLRGYRGEYKRDRATGEFTPVGYQEPLEQYFSL
ncbi:MAG: aminotransferase class V-fold PLP-dependent enzyme [Anaerolineales bacterium]